MCASVEASLLLTRLSYTFLAGCTKCSTNVEWRKNTTENGKRNKIITRPESLLGTLPTPHKHTSASQNLAKNNCKLYGCQESIILYYSKFLTTPSAEMMARQV